MQTFGPGVNFHKNSFKLNLDICTNEICLKTWWGGGNFKKRKYPYNFQNKVN